MGALLLDGLQSLDPHRRPLCGLEHRMGGAAEPGGVVDQDFVDGEGADQRQQGFDTGTGLADVVALGVDGAFAFALDVGS